MAVFNPDIGGGNTAGGAPDRQPGMLREGTMKRGGWILVVPMLLAFADVNAAARPAGFYADYVRVKDPDYREWNEAFRQERALEAIADELNKIVRIPTAVALSFDECGESNAYYDPDEQRVTMCFEMAEEVVEMFGEERSEDELDDLVAGTLLFFLGHEVGHALTHVLDLPITGREEDAVDQLAVLLLSDGSEDSESALVAVSETFSRWSEEEEADDETFADVHSLNSQRLYNILCWSYGRDPEAYADLVDDGFLPEDRAEGCADEYDQLSRSWNRLLDKHLVADEPPPRKIVKKRSGGSQR